MVRRDFFMVIISFAVLAAVGAALWQSRAVLERDSVIAELRKFLSDADKAADLAAQEKQDLENRLRKTADQLAAAKSIELETLRVELAAAHQQLSVAERAMIETEDRLAQEIAAHAALKRKAENPLMHPQGAVRNKPLSEGEPAADMAAPVAPSDQAPTAPMVETSAVPNPVEATGSIGASAIERATEQVSAAKKSNPKPKAASRKARPRADKAPVIRAVKPGGGLFDPLL